MVCLLFLFFLTALAVPPSRHFDIPFIVHTGNGPRNQFAPIPHHHHHLNFPQCSIGEEYDILKHRCVVTSCKSPNACGSNAQCQPEEVAFCRSPCPRFICIDNPHCPMGEELDVFSGFCTPTSCESSNACKPGFLCKPSPLQMCFRAPCEQFRCIAELSTQCPVESPKSFTRCTVDPDKTCEYSPVTCCPGKPKEQTFFTVFANCVENWWTIQMAHVRCPVCIDLIAIEIIPVEVIPVKVWKETSSGVKYHIVESGSGRKAKLADFVVVEYKGTLQDENGDVFDSSFEENKRVKFKVNSKIEQKGLVEALLLMQEGGMYEFLIPSDLAYGENGVKLGEKHLTIGPNEDLYYYYVLHEIWSETSSGLQYRIINPGNVNSPKPITGDTVAAHYQKLKMNKDLYPELFESSHEGDSPAELRISDLLVEIQEALGLMNEGATYEFLFPSHLFIIELIEILN